ncbi:hypothetical protein [Dyadobacter sp. NIV53]|uniref:hypothetical protein n=1 Tax=Dyadobacter sp. NIV53 TaxID=2861765 RepID=UPI001C868A3D|nr:hypothetical protein [Dyadobacter sp. NIV53]
MIYEKTFLQIDESLVRIIITGHIAPGGSWMRTEMEVLVENPDDKCFYPPVTAGHFAYAKLKMLNKEQAGQLQIFYSGITVGQINQALAEFEQIRKSSVIY